jgi:hypothetical protein
MVDVRAEALDVWPGTLDVRSLAPDDDRQLTRPRLGDTAGDGGIDVADAALCGRRGHPARAGGHRRPHVDDEPAGRHTCQQPLLQQYGFHNRAAGQHEDRGVHRIGDFRDPGGDGAADLVAQGVGEGMVAVEQDGLVLGRVQPGHRGAHPTDADEQCAHPEYLARSSTLPTLPLGVLGGASTTSTRSGRKCRETTASTESLPARGPAGPAADDQAT